MGNKQASPLEHGDNLKLNREPRAVGGVTEIVTFNPGRIQGSHWKAAVFVENLLNNRAASSVGRYVDQLNLNVPQYTNANPAQNNAPGTTNQERAFQIALARKRQFEITLGYDF